MAALLRLALLVLVAVFVSAPVKAQAPNPLDFSTEVVTIRIGQDRTSTWVRYLLIKPLKKKSGDAVMLFAGGNGLLGISMTGTIGTNLDQNFLVRSRMLFASRGLPVAVIDAQNGVAMDGNIRLSDSYAALMSAVIADVRSKTQSKRVWLVGTSAGTLSAASVASHFPLQFIPQFPNQLPTINAARPNGVVLTSTQRVVTATCGKVVTNAILSAINVPTYVVAHRDDACPCSPAAEAPDIVAALAGTNAKGRMEFVGGDPATSTDPCQALTPHGFLGIEAAVVTNIAAWIANH